MIIPFLPQNELSGLSYLIGIGAGVFFIFGWALSIGWSFVVIGIGSYVYNWVIVKLGGTDDAKAVMKINWYLQGYGVLLFACGYMAILVLMAIFGFLFDSSNLASVIYFVGTLALGILSFWVSLELMARQVMLTKMKVFIASILTAVIFVVVWLLFMVLIGGCASLMGR